MAKTTPENTAVYVLDIKTSEIMLEIPCDDEAEAKRQGEKLDAIIDHSKYLVDYPDEGPIVGEDNLSSMELDAEKWDNYYRDNGRGL
jgi:hypothetical protein